MRCVDDAGIEVAETPAPNCERVAVSHVTFAIDLELIPKEPEPLDLTDFYVWYNWYYGIDDGSGI